MRAKRLIICSFVFFSSLLAEAQKEPDIACISETIGHMIAKRLELINMQFDIPQLVKGIQDGCNGKEAPISEEICIEVIRSTQEKNFKELGKVNLKQAQSFLDCHAKDEGAIILEEGKIQYHVIAQGKGPEIKPHSSPFVRYTVKTINGSVIGSANQEEFISLDQTTAGLQAGLLGMKEGEKRVLYIHPDLSYGEKGCLLFPPNILLIFEIEALKIS